MNIQENVQKGSYAILPSYIMDDENLDEGAKILYARISMYASEGRCWASNKHFAEKQNVTIRCIQNWLKQLVDAQHIEVEIETGGFQTKRNIWLIIDFKNSFTRRTTVHPPAQCSSPLPEPQFTPNIRCINTSKINKILPPLSSKFPESHLGEGVEKEEEDFSFISIYNLSASQIKQLKTFPAGKVKESLELAYANKKVKSKVGWTLTRLNNPEKFSTPLEEKYTPNQILALKHNEFLKSHFPPELYEKNKEDILKNGFMTGFHKNGLTTTFSCKDSKHDLELSADIEISQEGAKNRQVMRKRK